jgi:hypothetical protein
LFVRHELGSRWARVAAAAGPAGGSALLGCQPASDEQVPGVGSRGGRQVPTRQGQVAAAQPESRGSVRRGPAQLSGVAMVRQAQGHAAWALAAPWLKGRSSPREEEER